MGRQSARSPACRYMTRRALAPQRPSSTNALDALYQTGEAEAARVDVGRIEAGPMADHVQPLLHKAVGADRRGVVELRRRLRAICQIGSHTHAGALLMRSDHEREHPQQRFAAG